LGADFVATNPFARGERQRSIRGRFSWALRSVGYCRLLVTAATNSRQDYRILRVNKINHVNLENPVILSNNLL
jgi:hypothetical protein